MSVTVYGASDDLIEVDGDVTEEFYASNDEDLVYLAFSDGTVLKVLFDAEGIWRITHKRRGSSEVEIIQCPPEQDDVYSDRAVILGGVQWVVYGNQIAEA